MRRSFPDLPFKTRTSKTQIAASVFVLCCLISTVRILKDSPLPTSLNNDKIASRSDQRFAALKAMLPERGVVGYIGDPGRRDPGNSAADYYLAQYALAPLVVDRSTKHPLVVGNFVDSPPMPAPASNLQLVRDFGNGVMLFANRDAR
jgi:hypothetical protein